jgi:hypothetical protein
VDVSGEGVAEVGRGALVVLPAVVAVSEVDGERRSTMERREEDGGSSSKLLLHEEGVTADRTLGSDGDGGGRRWPAPVSRDDRWRVGARARG